MEKFGLSAALVAVLVGTAGFSEPLGRNWLGFCLVHEG